MTRLSRLAIIACLAALPAAAADAPASRQSVLDALYDRLAQAKSDDEAQGIAGAIDRIHMRADSDTTDLLMTRALAAVSTGDTPLAIRLLSAVIRIDPAFTEAWNKRATLYFARGDNTRSMADIAETLRRDPRHFGAWAGLGLVLRDSGDKKGAYAAFERALTINPHLDAARKAVEDLKPEVEGHDI